MIKANVFNSAIEKKEAEERAISRLKQDFAGFLEEPSHIEIDPHGLTAHDPGAKLDAGKIRPHLVLMDFALALTAVAEVGTYGAAKYSDHGWLSVPNGIERYSDAKVRHQLAAYTGARYDAESGLSHAAHECWNALARLELILRQEQSAE